MLYQRIAAAVRRWIAAAGAESKWTDWKVAHVEKGPFLNEFLGDRYRRKQEGILSVMAQEAPDKVHQPTPLRILDFSFEESSDERAN